MLVAVAVVVLIYLYAWSYSQKKAELYYNQCEGKTIKEMYGYYSKTYIVFDDLDTLVIRHGKYTATYKYREHK